MISGKIEFHNYEECKSFIQKCCNIFYDKNYFTFLDGMECNNRKVYVSIYDTNGNQNTRIAAGVLMLNQDIPHIIAVCQMEQRYEGSELVIRMLSDYAFSHGYDTVISDGYINGCLDQSIFNKIGYKRYNDSLKINEKQFYHNHC